MRVLVRSCHPASTNRRAKAAQSIGAPRGRRALVPEVAGRTFKDGFEIVVVTGDEYAGATQQRIEGLQDRRPGVGGRQNVAGQNDQIGHQPAEVVQPFLLRLLPLEHVQVR